MWNQFHMRPPEAVLACVVEPWGGVPAAVSSSRVVMARTYVVTGAASGDRTGHGRTPAQRGARVIGVDVRSVDVVADLSTPQGRQEAIDGIAREAGRRLDVVIANAGMARPTAATWR